LELQKDGAQVSLPARKTEALLAILALRPGVPFGRERLLAWLWPEVPEAQGRTSLRQALGHLRKLLAPELVVSAADKVHLEPSAAWVDTSEVDRVLRAPPAEREALLSTWRGELLEGFPAVEDAFGDWLAAERGRLSERVGLGLEECLAALSSARHADRALAVGFRLLEIEPTREAAHRALMRLFVERGDRASALRQYERCREFLERRFQIAPSSETEALRRAIAEVEPEVAQPPSSPRPDAEKSESESEADGRLTLVIIPFEYTADAPEGRILAELLTEDVSRELARFRQLAVVAGRSVAELVARGTSLEEVAHTTGARLVLSGNVRVAAERARVTATLVDATTHLHVWSERWDAAHDDPFGAVDRLTRNVVGALALRIDETRLGFARRRPRERLEVYECWLRGLECLRRGTPSSDEEARGFFEQALELAPSFARAYSGISLSHFNDWSCQAWERWDEREQLAFEAARRAVELDDSDHVTHSILARIYVYRREFARGERHLEQALALNANDADMLMHAAVAFVQLGDSERAQALAATALRVNPRHPDWYYGCAGWPLFLSGRLAEAIAIAERAPDALVDTRALLAAASAHASLDVDAREHARLFMQQFQRKIAFGREPRAGEAVRWLLRVNPLKRARDEAFLVEGLERAGVHAGEFTPPRADS
jgi:DNA-binding SARP family transcriptional activator